jgi:predicted esterase
MAYQKLNLKNDTILTEEHLSHIEDGIVNMYRSNTKDYQRKTYFTIDVECTQPNTTIFTSTSLDTNPRANKIYKDNCVLYLPTTYSISGNPVKLVIFCKQGSSQITASSDPIDSINILPYFLYLGYAILGVDGMPDGLTSELKLDDTRVVGNYVAVRATELAYNYVINNYNIDSTGCFIFGYSQGGHYAQNVVDITNIPILAAAQMSPVCSMRYHQWDLKTSKTINGVTFTKPARLNIARLYGFNTVNTDTELTNLQYNKNNVCGFDPWERNVIDPYEDFVQSGNLWYLPEGTTLDDIKMKKYTKAPLKIWCAENDTAISCDVMKVYIKAIKNAGQVADIRVYSTGGHGIHTSQYTIENFTENGTSKPLKPVAFEMAQWFNHFGGYLPKINKTLENPDIIYTPDFA